MSMYGYDLSFDDFGFSDPSINTSLYRKSFSPLAAAIDYDDDVYVRRIPPPRQTRSSPPKRRYDGTSPLPLGMEWSLPPRIWEGKSSVWPQDSPKGWSYCVTIPSWTMIPSSSGSDTVFFRVQVGIQSPEGITTIREVVRRFNEFLQLYSELKKEFPKKKLPLAPPRKLMKMRSTTLLEERRRALEVWMEKLLSEIDVSRTAHVAIFLELEAAARQACCESEDELAQLPSTLPGSGSSIITSDMDNSCAYESSDLSAPRPEKENYAEPNIDNASKRGKIDSVGENFRDNSSVTSFNEDFAEGKHEMSNQPKKLYRKSEKTIDGYHNDGIVESSGLDSDFGGLDWESSSKRLGKDVSSIGADEASNLGLESSLGGSSQEQSAEGDLAVLLPSDECHKVNRVLTTVQQRLGTTKMDMEDLIARLNQEMVARQYLTTKVKDLEMELETRSQSSRKNMQQAFSTESERCTDMQWGMEELRRKCMELELKLTAEQEARERAESIKTSTIQQNEMLVKELDEAKEQAEILRKQQDEVELKSKSDAKVLVKEVKSLRISHSELKQELSKCLEEKVELEKEKQKWESENAVRMALLDEFELVRNQLQECSVNFLGDGEDEPKTDACLSDVDETCDDQIGLVARDEDGAGDDKLRRVLSDILSDNAKLRKQVKSVTRYAHALKVKDDDASNKIE